MGGKKQPKGGKKPFIKQVKTGIIQRYDVVADGVPAKVKIEKTEHSFVPLYNISFPKIEPATKAVLDEIRERLITEMDITPSEVLTPEGMNELKKAFSEKVVPLIESSLTHLPESEKQVLAGILLHNSLGLGGMEMLLQDKNLEEVVINGSKEPIWVYHREKGWLKTNMTLPSEVEIYNYAAQIGRKVGTQITNLSPLMDAYLTTGDRANATLFPISSHGNTMTIRKFARRPWTITDFIKSNTVPMDIAAFLWLALQYEMNSLIAGGTASGKTALLNVLMCFIPPTQRVISIEDTREMQLPDFLHWVPMTTRPANPEGKGEVSMLQLMINALRMRPDRMIVGEIRRSREAEVLFEAIHTGHSVYATMHANTANETLRRLTNPPINIPPALLGSLHLIVVMHRDRRRDLRRVLEVAELVDVSSGDKLKMEVNPLFKWMPGKDEFMPLEKSRMILERIKMFTGMSDSEVDRSLKEKKDILHWLVKKDVNDLNTVGKIVSEYYMDPEKVLKGIKKGEIRIDSLRVG